jgi:competence protein ComEA
MLGIGIVHMAVSRMRHRTMIDINSGTFDQLKTLVGIGDTYAKRIVEGRPYQRTDELVTKKIIPQMTYDKIKDHILMRTK